MNRLRNKSLVRLLIVFMMISMGTVIVSPEATAEGNTVQYADWLLKNVLDTSEPGVRRAVLLASEDGARSFEEFLASFQNELEAMHGSSDQSQERTTHRLLQELRFMFKRFVGQALLFRQLSAVSTTCGSGTTVFSSQNTRLNGVSSIKLLSFRPGLTAVFDCSTEKTSVIFLGSAAQPLGP